MGQRRQKKREKSLNRRRKEDYNRDLIGRARTANVRNKNNGKKKRIRIRSDIEE